jgi:hypothetical protein
MRASADEQQLDLAIVPVDESQFDQEDEPKPKPKKKAKEKKVDTVELPMLVEIAFTFSGILLVAVSLVVAAISFITGAAPLEIFLRTLVTIMAMGGVLWLFNWQFNTGVMQSAMRALEEEEKEKIRLMEEQVKEQMTGLEEHQLEGLREV